MASRPKTRARLQGALASRKDKRTSYPLPATHQEAPRNRFWGLFLSFRYKRASSSVNALRTALRPSRRPPVLQLLSRCPHLLRLGGQRAHAVAVECLGVLAQPLALAVDERQLQANHIDRERCPRFGFVCIPVRGVNHRSRNRPAPRWRDFAPPNHPANHYRYRISDSHGRGRSTSPPVVICHLSFVTLFFGRS